MMNLKRVSLPVLLMLGGVMLSCDSNDDISCAEDFTGDLTTSEEVLVGEWNLSAVVAEDEIDLSDDEVENPTTDLLSQYTACQKDVAYIFDAERNFTIEQSYNVADCAEKGQLAGTWMLNGEALNLVYACSRLSTGIDIHAEGTTFSFTGIENIQDINGQIIETTVTYTYTKQLEN
ncbi:DUF5004 domain-containing protein [Zhouia amylolytica]|uniref:Uncharacterized protein n=1 Tax=Zhouia amylolytica AD3 TaxID=1286632 RepID=W2UKY4_9FLAO|nr:DUF5004 domain-containing protein [Zhouia amylolytica]ETN94800.1 hypothetical protein P278_27430 [Zhouia amylolytica AD3]